MVFVIEIVVFEVIDHFSGSRVPEDPARDGEASAGQSSTEMQLSAGYACV